MTTNNVPVTKGLFMLKLDFGSAPFIGPARWLQIQVTTHGGGAYSTLSPRQLIGPAPYANYAYTAGNVTNSAITSAQLADGAVNTSQLAANAVDSSKIAANQVVKSLNALKDNVTLVAGANVTLNTLGNSLQISALAGGLALPYNGSVSLNGTAFAISNSFSGNYGQLGLAGAGVYGSSSLANGVAGSSASAGDSGVYGVNSGGGFGVAGRTIGGGPRSVGTTPMPAAGPGISTVAST